MFDSLGRFIRAIGKQGDGPGEYGRRIRQYQLSGDSLVIFGDRMIVYSPSLAVARSSNLPRGLGSGSAFLGDGSAVMTASISTPASVGLEWHVVDAKGKVTKSFGEEAKVTVPGPRRGVISLAGVGYFILAPSRDAIWAWSSATYRGELWSISSGRKIRDLRVVDVPWIPSTPPTLDLSAATRAASAGRPLPPAAIAYAALVRVDAQGRFWVSADVPFRIGDRLTGKFAECANNAESELMKGWRVCFLLEVVDPVSKTLLVSRYVSAGMRAVPGTDLYQRGFEDASGIPRATIWRARLVGRQ